MRKIIRLLFICIVMSIGSLYTYAAGPSFKMVANNENLKLYLNEKTCEIALETQEGQTFYSNPQDRKKDTIATGAFKTHVASQAIVTLHETKTNNEVLKNSAVGSVNKKTFSIQPIEQGVEIQYVFEKEDISFVMQYVLDETSLKVVIPADKIQENEAYKIKKIEVLPYFGAANMEEEGYIFVPDGSGALMNFNQPKRFYTPYQAPIYGVDHMYNSKSQNTMQNVYMPMFGVNKEDTGFIAVMDEGDALSHINAISSGVNTSYNMAYFTIELRQEESVHVGLANVRKIDTNSLEKTNFVIHYYPLDPKHTDYVGMAKKYELLLKYDSKEDTGHPLYLTLYGAVKKKEYKFGFPVEVIKPLTTYKQAVEILKDLKERGVDKVVLNYKAAAEEVLEGKLSTKFKPIRKLGGERDLNKLVEYCKNNDIELFMEADFVKFSDEDFLTKTMDSAQNLGKMPIKKYQSNLVTGDKLENAKHWRLVSPNTVLKSVTKYGKSLEKYDLGGVSVGSLANVIYSDYSKNLALKQGTKAYWQQAMEELVRQNKNILVDNANIYAYEYSGHHINVPMQSSQFDMLDESIPFYQILMSGHTAYATKPINGSENPTMLFLNAIETGSRLHYEWIYNDVKVLKDTEYEGLYSAQYQDWIEDAENKYKEIEALHQAIEGASIIGHEEVAQDVKKTVYENGVEVYVNYNEEDLKLANHVRIGAKGYQIVK